MATGMVEKAPPGPFWERPHSLIHHYGIFFVLLESPLPGGLRGLSLYCPVGSIALCGACGHAKA